MSINTEATPVTYDCNGVTTDFPITFTYIEDEYVWVRVKDGDSLDVTTLSLGSDYTIVSDEVVTEVTYPTGDTLYISLLVPITQLTDFILNGKFDSDVLEAAMDKLTLIAQKINLDTESIISLEVPEVPTPSMKLPDATDRASAYLAFDAAGNIAVVKALVTGTVTVSVYGETLIAAASASAARTILDVASAAEVAAIEADVTTNTDDLETIMPLEAGTNITISSVTELMGYLGGLPKNLGGYDVRFNISAVLATTDTIEVEGFYNGTLEIVGQTLDTAEVKTTGITTTAYTAIRVYNCSARINIAGLMITSASTPINVKNSSYVYILICSAITTGSTYNAISVSCGGTVHLSDFIVGGTYNAIIYGASGSRITSSAITGTGMALATYIVDAYTGAFITYTGTLVGYSTNINSGALLFDDSGIVV